MPGIIGTWDIRQTFKEFEKCLRIVWRNRNGRRRWERRRRRKWKFLSFSLVLFLLFSFSLPVAIRSLTFSVSNVRRKLVLIALGWGILPTPCEQGNFTPTRLPERPERSNRKCTIRVRRVSLIAAQPLTLHRHATRTTCDNILHPKFN